MNETRLASTSVEYVMVPIEAEADDGTDLDPTDPAAPVWIAFLAPNAAAPVTGSAAWRVASWQNRPAGRRTQHLARTLVGTGTAGGALAAGEYKPWVKITLGVETVIRQGVGSLRVI